MTRMNLAVGIIFWTPCYFNGCTLDDGPSGSVLSAQRKHLESTYYLSTELNRNSYGYFLMAWVSQGVSRHVDFTRPARTDCFVAEMDVAKPGYC